MAGHSKWANIRHKKAAVDAKRGKIFTKIIRELTVASRQCGGDSDNPKLRMVIDKALTANMKRDTIDKAIKRGSGAQDDDIILEEIRYEGYGVAGVAVLVDCLTDNRNRTVAEVRHAFTKYGGNLGTDGSVSYLFTKQGQLTFEPGANEDNIMEAALEAGADDVIVHDDKSIDVITSPENFSDIKEHLASRGLEPAHAAVTMAPATSISLDGEQAESLIKMIERLEDLDDVQDVYTNADFPEEMMES